MNQERGRILLADDEDVFLRATADLLRREGYKCMCVQNAEEAAVALQMSSYDLLISDINMPGNQALQLLRTIPEGLPVLIVTGYPSVPTAIQALRLNVVDYLVKPLDMAALLRCIPLAIRKKQVWQAMHKMREDIVTWTGQLDRLQQTMLPKANENSNGGIEWELDHFLDQSVLHITRFATGIIKTLEVVKRGPIGPREDVCALLKCPRRRAYMEGIRDAIDVLERTKHAFKSKDLGALRQRLERLLQE